MGVNKLPKVVTTYATWLELATTESHNIQGKDYT